MQCTDPILLWSCLLDLAFVTQKTSYKKLQSTLTKFLWFFQGQRKMEMENKNLSTYGTKSKSIFSRKCIQTTKVYCTLLCQKIYTLISNRYQTRGSEMDKTTDLEARNLNSFNSVKYGIKKQYFGIIHSKSRIQIKFDVFSSVTSLFIYV